MIVFDLSCEQGHRFEGWFSSSAEFERQQSRGLVACPNCSSNHVAKAPMAPAVAVKGNRKAAAGPAAPKQALANSPMPPEVRQALQHLADVQARALQNSTWVGDGFAEQSRKMHYGEQDAQTIHGQATPDEARALADEGIPVSALPFPVAPPDELN
ncbi:MAG: DUF1178 family protein [Croceibacterium sp.]